MKKLLFILLLAMMASLIWAQGTEDFTNLPTDSPNNYLSRSWTGTDGVIWTAEGARTSETLDGKAICFGTSGNRWVTSPTYSGGMGTLTFKYVRGFTSGQESRKLQVYVNNQQIGSEILVDKDSDTPVLYSQAINISGNVVLQIRSTGTRQVIVDTIEWTSYAGGDPTITVDPNNLTGFSYLLGSGPSASQNFIVSGSNLTEDILITAPAAYEIKKDGDTNYLSSLNLNESGGTVAATTINVRLKEGLSAGSYSQDVTVSSGSKSQAVSCKGNVLKYEPTNYPTEFAAEDGPTPYSEITLTWERPTAGVLPDGYIIKASDVGFNDIADPADGVVETSSSLVRNIPAPSTETYTFINLNGETTYYFKIYSYTNSGSDINYKTDGAVPSVSHKTKSGPALEEVLFPQYIQGFRGTNNDRVTWAARLTLKNLNPNSTYRYYPGFVYDTDALNYNAAGNPIYVNPDNTFTRATARNFTTAGNYSEFTTDASGSYTGWFMAEPTGNERFDAGNEIYFRLMLNDGDDGTTVALRLTSQSSIKVLRFDTETSSYQGTLLWGETDAPGKYFMAVYDNEAGTGRPINMNVIESDGLDITGVTQILEYYRDHIDNVNGAWGLIIPNCLMPTGGPGFPGIKRLEIRDFETGEIYSWCTSPDGIWNGVSTVAPLGGKTNPIKIDCKEEGTVPVELSSFTATISANNFVQLNWVTQTETGVMGYYIYRAMNDDLASALLVSPMIAATNTSHAQSYAFVDSEIYEPGMYYYWLQNSDFDGSSNFHGPISIQFNMGGHDGTAPEIPLTTQLMAAFPNPFNPSTRIPYQLAKAGNVDIRIYNSRGQLVRSYPMGMKEAGYHAVTWDGLAEDGSECGTGVYYIRMQTGDKSYGSKAVMIK
ncbi:MAG: T9SS type A sorting domain-containing protein [Candidatus Cloacimonetes bacterium]|nr:T9SS type A sorting domain-containing protein [Candidatus Cloacimonadota bacterium]